MCGIAGNVRFRSGPPADREALRTVRDCMRSRGPDHAADWVSPDGRAALGHRRLSIIDLSAAGHQPMSTADGQLTIVFNGEIYNHAELRESLAARGHRFRSASDTEVLLLLYRQHGLGMFSLLRGMYAFALWVEAEKRLLLARDPLGIKPLYYAAGRGEVWFASQVQALRQAGIPLSEEPAGHVGFHLWGNVPEPYTLYREIRQVPAGGYLTFDSAGRQEAGSFWSLEQEIKHIAGGPGSRAPMRQTGRESLQAALRSSVAAHLVADVDVGIFLSAGRDSTTLLALASEVARGGLRTFTVGFEEFRGTPNDETVLARQVARRYGADHREHFFSQGEVASAMEDFLGAMDQPSIDGLNSYLVSRAAAASGLRVSLSGVGGDEIFAGYDTFSLVPRMVSRISAVPFAARVGKMMRVMAHPVVRRLASPKYSGLIEFGATPGGAYLLRRGLYLPWELPQVLDPDLVRAGLRELLPLPRLEGLTGSLGSSVPAVALLEMSYYLRNQLLRDTDWASMAHSLEVRTPFVDAVLLAQVLRIAAEHGWPRKSDMAATPAAPLPPEILSRRKTGFTIPAFDPRLGPGTRREPPQRRWARTVYQEYRRRGAGRRIAA